MAGEHLALGVATAFTSANLLACLAGVFLGTLIGVLPGLGPVTSVPTSVPKRGPTTILRQPTPTKKAIKKRA